MTYMAPNDLKWLLKFIYVSEGSIEVIWDHLELFKSWGDKICYTIDMQRSLSFFLIKEIGHSEAAQHLIDDSN